MCNLNNSLPVCQWKKKYFKQLQNIFNQLKFKSCFMIDWINLRRSNSLVFWPTGRQKYEFEQVRSFWLQCYYVHEVNILNHEWLNNIVCTYKQLCMILSLNCEGIQKKSGGMIKDYFVIMAGLFCKSNSLNPMRFLLARETDTKKLSNFSKFQLFYDRIW